MTECGVCYTSRATVAKCGACDFEICRSCAQRCAGDSGIAECVQCKRPWSEREQRKQFSAHFLSTKFRKRKREVLAVREDQWMPATEPYARAERLANTMREHARGLEHQLRALDAERQRLRREIDETQQTAANLATGIGVHGAVVGVHGRCVHEGCRGFLDASFTCGTCEKRTCSQCMCPLFTGVFHACNPASIASVERIRQDCKPCVRCGEMTARTEGCSTMWCVVCHAFWDWNTMREVPVQHNPDYHDWLLRTHQGAPRRDPGDIECGGLPLRSEISRALNRLRNPAQAASIPDLDVHTVAYAQACLLTVHDAIRPRFLLEWDEEAIGRDTRVAWLNRRINTEQLGIRREQLDRRLRFRRAVGEVLRTFVHAGADCLQRFCQSQVSLSQCASELRTLRHLINDELKEIALDFAPGVGRPHAITTDWGWS